MTCGIFIPDQRSSPETLECLGSTDSKTLDYQRTNPPAAAAAKSLQSCPTVQPHRRQPTRLLRFWDSPGKNTGVRCHFLLQEGSIFIKIMTFGF